MKTSPACEPLHMQYGLFTGSWNWSAIQLQRLDFFTKPKDDVDVFLRIPETKSVFEKSFQEGIQQGDKMVIETMEAVWDWSFNPAEIHIPAVMFYGDKDDMIDNQMTMGRARQLPDSSVKEWKKVSHCGFFKRG